MILLLMLGAALLHQRAPADSVRYRLYKFERLNGEEQDAVVPASGGDSITSAFAFTDRGTRVALNAAFARNADGAPRSFMARGATSRMSGAAVTVAFGTDGSARVHSGSDSTVSQVQGPTFPSIGYSPVIMQQALVDYWRTHGRPARIALLPTGGVTITDRGADSIEINGRRTVLRRIGVRDLVWGRETLWLDSANRLVALVTRDAEFDHFEALADGCEPALTTFVERAAADEMAELADITKSAGKDGDFALVGATLVDGTDHPAVPDAVIVVQGGKITAAGPRASVRIPRGIATVDARGKTVLPGLWDMHAHAEQVDWGPLYLAAGVTTARDVGNEKEFIVSMRDALRKGRGVGPRMLLAGVIDGGGDRAIGVDTAVTPEQGAKLVDEYLDAGFDQIKVYSSLTPDVLRAITTEAHRRHVTVTGHIPFVMNIYDGVNDGMDQVNHISYVLAAARDSTFKPSPGHAVAPLDSVRLARVVAFLAAHHTVLDPTMALYELGLRTETTAPASVEPGIVKVAPALKGALNSVGGTPAAMAEQMALQRANMLAVIGALHRAGVPIVAGTDQSVPGYSLHREMELYVEAGFTPLEAIQAATSVPARVMGLIRETGTVEAGKRADLLVVTGDPLARIADTRNVWLVVANGRRFDPAPLWRSVGFEP